MSSVDSTAATLAAAFVAAPLTRWTYGDDDHLEGRLVKVFTLWLSGLADLGHVWSAGDGAGVAVWLPSDDVAEIYAHDLRVREAIRALTLDGGVRHDHYWDWADARLEMNPHSWYLEGVGVRASHRRRGIATALVKHGLGLAGAEDAAAVVMVHEACHVAFFLRLGFGVTFEGRSPNNGPYTWVMVT